MKPPEGIDADQLLSLCVEAIATSDVDAEIRNRLLGVLGIFSGLVYDPQLIERVLPEGIMQESSIIQHYMKQARTQGIEQGQKKATIESILALLGSQFSLESIQFLKPHLEEIEDMERLKELLLAVPDTKSLREFTKSYLI